MIKILSIDDSKVIHSYLENIFLNVANVIHAYDGEEGLSLLKLNPEVDLVLLDWEMPKLSGIETLKKARSNGSKVPIIMVTSKNSTEDISEALNLGATDYIMKPFVSDIVVEKIETTLGKRIK